MPRWSRKTKISKQQCCVPWHLKFGLVYVRDPYYVISCLDTVLDDVLKKTKKQTWLYEKDLYFQSLSFLKIKVIIALPAWTDKFVFNPKLCLTVKVVEMTVCITQTNQEENSMSWSILKFIFNGWSLFSFPSWLSYYHNLSNCRTYP